MTQLVKKMVSDSPAIEELMRQGVISNAALAEKFLPAIEKNLGKKVKRSSIVMALRRYEESLKERSAIQMRALFKSDIAIKSGITDIGVERSKTIYEKLNSLYRKIDFSSGEILHIILANNEIGIIVNEKNVPLVMETLIEEEIIFKKENLAAIGLALAREHYNTPGVLFIPVRKFAFNNLNIFEIVSTSTELIFVVSEEDVSKAYNLLLELLKKETGKEKQIK